MKTSKNTHSSVCNEDYDEINIAHRLSCVTTRKTPTKQEDKTGGRLTKNREKQPQRRASCTKVFAAKTIPMLLVTIGVLILILADSIPQQVSAQRGGGDQEDDDFDDAGFDDSGYSQPQSRDAESSQNQPSEYSPANEDDLDDDDEVDESNAIAQIIAQQRQQQQQQRRAGQHPVDDSNYRQEQRSQRFYEPSSAVWTPVSQQPASRRLRRSSDDSEENDIEDANKQQHSLIRHKRYAKKKKTYIGPVYTYVKTDKHAHYKWGVKHKVGKHYG